MLTMIKTTLAIALEEDEDGSVKKAIRPVCLEVFRFFKVVFANDKSFK